MTIKNFLKENKTSLISSFFFVFIIFSIASNIAWLNPRPGFAPKCIMKKNIPFMWQYNSDSPMELGSGALFLKYLRKYKTRINRPTYPAIVNLFSKGFAILAGAVGVHDPYTPAVFAYIVLKWLVYTSGSVLFWKILRHYLDEQTTFFALGLMLFHHFAITYSATYHTGELQFFNPIFICYMFLNLSKKYSQKRLFCFSVLVGILMLAKQNYAVYGALLLTSAFSGHWAKAMMSFGIHFIPLLIWKFYLNMVDIPYYNHEMDHAKYGTWFFTEFDQYGLGGLAIEWLRYTFVLTPLALLKYFTIFLIIALAGSKYFFEKISLNKLEKRFILFFIFMLIVQVFACRRPQNYMTSDIALIVYAIASWAILSFVAHHNWSKEKAIKAFLPLVLIVNCFYITNFPWKAPAEQLKSTSKTLNNAPKNVLSN